MTRPEGIPGGVIRVTVLKLHPKFQAATVLARGGECLDLPIVQSQADLDERVAGLTSLRVMRSAKKRFGVVALLSAVFVTVGCTQDVEEDTHAVVEVRLTESEAATESPFGGTVAIELTAEYDPCFTSFYEANPNYIRDGVDGALIFGGEDLGGEGWADRLCDGETPGVVDCSVDSFQQVLEIGAIPTLTVRYLVTGAVADRTLLLGPLPTADLADCDGGGQPRVTLQSARGLGNNNGPVWSMENGGQQAAPGQGAPMIVKARAG